MVFQIFLCSYSTISHGVPKDVLQNPGDLGYDGRSQCNFISLFPRTASDMIIFCQCTFDGSIFVKYPNPHCYVISYIMLMEKAHKAGNVIGNYRFIITYPSICQTAALPAYLE